MNERGDVTTRMDNTGTVQSLTIYGAYGQIAEGVAPPADDPYGYKGGYGSVTDSDTGLVQMGLRQYDPATGRWLTRDPIGYIGGLNLYAYCDGDPVNLADPMGMDAGFGRMGNGDDPWGEKLAALQTVAQGLERARNDPRYFFGLTQCPGSDTNDPGMAAALDYAGQSIHNAVGVYAMSGGVGFSRRASNPFPEDGIFAKVMPQKFANDLADGVPGAWIAGGGESFITAAEDLNGYNSPADVAGRLSLVGSDGNLRLDNNAVVTFTIPSGSGIASPFNRGDVGFINGGRTGGGAREWVITRDVPIVLQGIRELK